jgi:methyl-accepting chemotaxis protein
VVSYLQSLARSLGLGEQRKAANFLLRPALQLKLPLYLLLLSLLFVLLALMLGNLYFEQTYVTMLQNTSQAEYVQQVISAQLGDFRTMSLLLLFVYALTTIVITAIFTHRLVGPLVPLSRHIRALTEGHYAHRVKLRSNDVLAELAEQLNELALTLEKRNRQDRP